MDPISALEDDPNLELLRGNPGEEKSIEAGGLTDGDALSLYSKVVIFRIADSEIRSSTLLKSSRNMTSEAHLKTRAS
jgi:hypothetical protein